MRRLRALLPAGFALLLSAQPFAAQPALSGPEVLLDPSRPSTATQDLCCLDVATDSTGRQMAIWLEEPSQLSRLRSTRVRGRLDGPHATWVRPAWTLPTGALPVLDATITAANPTGFVLIWRSAERVGAAVRLRLTARRFTIAGASPDPPFEIRPPVLTSEVQQAIEPPHAAADRDALAVVWSEIDPASGTLALTLRRFDERGRALTPPLRLAAQEGNGDRRASALAIGPDRRIHVAWTSQGSASDPAETWTRRYTQQGEPLGRAVRVGRIDALGFAPDGTLSTARSAPEAAEVVLQAFSRDGIPRPERRFAFRPEWSPARLIANPAGGFLLAATPRFGIAPLPCPIYGTAVARDGTPRGPTGCLTAPATLFSNELAGFAATAGEPGGWSLVWGVRRSNEEPHTTVLSAQRLASRGAGTIRLELDRAPVLEGACLAVVRLLRRDGIDGRVTVDYQIAGAVERRGEISFANGDSRPRALRIPFADDPAMGPDRTVRVSIFEPGGGVAIGEPSVAVIKIRDDDSPSPLLAAAGPPVVAGAGADPRFDTLARPHVAASAAGEILAAWGHVEVDRFTHREDDSFAWQRFAADGRPTVALEDALPAELARVRTLLEPSGAAAIFLRDRNGASSLRRYAASGAEVVRRVLSLAIDDVAPLPGGGSAVVGRSSDTAGEALVLHALGVDGLDMHPPTLVTRAVLMPGSPTAIATDTQGNAIVVWAAAPTGAAPSGIFVRRYDAAGAPLGPARRALRHEGLGHSPAVALDADGRFVVVWQEGWTGDHAGIAARRFGPDGVPISTAMRIDSDPAGDAAAPAIAVADDGRFAIVWQQGERILGQLFRRSGERHGGEATIAEHGETPTIAWSSQGFFVVAFARNALEIDVRRLPLAP